MENFDIKKIICIAAAVALAVSFFIARADSAAQKADSNARSANAAVSADVAISANETKASDSSIKAEEKPVKSVETDSSNNDGVEEVVTGYIKLKSSGKTFYDLESAIEEAQPGETIEFLVEEYQFTEEIALDKPLKFVGKNGSGTKLIGYKIPNEENYQYPADAFYINCESGDFEFENLHFEKFGFYHENGERTSQEDIYGEAITLEDTRIRAASDSDATDLSEAQNNSETEIGIKTEDTNNLNLKVTNCSFEKFGGRAALLINGGDEITIDGCKFDAGESTFTAVNLIELAGGREIRISNCEFKNVFVKDDRFASNAITAFSSVMDGSKVEVTGCTFKNCEDSAIRFEGYQGEGKIDFKVDKSNLFENCGKAYTYASKEESIPSGIDAVTVAPPIRGFTPVVYDCKSEEGFDISRVYYLYFSKVPELMTFYDTLGNTIDYNTIIEYNQPLRFIWSEEIGGWVLDSE